MSIENQKTLWWMLLPFFAGPCLYALVGELYSGGTLDFRVVVFNAMGAALACNRLKKCYAREPLTWHRKWQISLADLLSIVLFFGITMGLVRAVNPARFKDAGVVISSAIGVAYVVVLLTILRMRDKDEPHLKKWLEAFGLIYAASFLSLAGILIESLIGVEFIR